jgi:hypothetical protein
MGGNLADPLASNVNSVGELEGLRYYLSSQPGVGYLFRTVKRKCPDLSYKKGDETGTISFTLAVSQHQELLALVPRIGLKESHLPIHDSRKFQISSVSSRVRQLTPSSCPALLARAASSRLKTERASSAVLAASRTEATRLFLGTGSFGNNSPGPQRNLLHLPADQQHKNIFNGPVIRRRNCQPVRQIFSTAGGD